MTNWKTYRIIKKDTFADYITFEIDGEATFEFGVNFSSVSCINGYPFKNYEKGDYLEINLDKIRRLGPTYPCDTSVVRKVSSSAVVSGSSGQMSLSREQAEVFADRLANRVEQSGGRYELDAYIQQGTEPHGTPYTRQGWIYRKKS